MQIGANELLLTVLLHTPIMRIKADQIRLVNNEGQVYGMAKEINNHLPLITGIIDTPTNKDGYQWIKTSGWMMV